MGAQFAGGDVVVKRGYDEQLDIEKRLFENNRHNKQAMFTHPPYSLEQQLVRAIAGGDRAGSVRVLGEINARSRATLAEDPLRSLKNSLIGSVALFARAAIAGGASDDDAFTLSDACIQALEAQSDPRTLEALEQAIAMRFIDLVEAQVLGKMSPVTRQAIRYIDGHLSEELELNVIARAGFVHPAHLSRQFKKDTGEAVSRYIQRRRVEEARHFLRYTNSSLTDIAGFYQFCSQSYFIQVFKKYTGMTPAEYRKGANWAGAD